jgi:hypothetical protein
MKTGWKTHAIGRHLVDLPDDAKAIESYRINNVKVEPLPNIKTQASFDLLVSEREKELRAAKHKTRGSMFVERVPHANRSVTLISWEDSSLESMYRFDTYFRADSKSLRYSGNVTPDRKQAAADRRNQYAQEWHELKPGETPEGIGFVVDGAILVDKDFNPESWSISVEFAGKPDVNFGISAYALKKVEEPLRKRTAEVHGSLLARFVGLSHLRNRERPVGPIWGEEILTAGTEKGKRAYAFKWEAPGKAWSVAEPQIGIELGVIESAYETNKESFATDEEALELWDPIVDSIRLRPGAV